MTSQFLTELAGQLRNGKNATCRRAIQQALSLVTAKFEAGKYAGTLEAESELRGLIEQTCLRISTKPA